DSGRREWMNEVLLAFNECARVNPIIGVGDVPGLALNFVREAYPNPSVAGAASVRFSLAQPAKVTIRFYNVAGRLVHEATVDGHVGVDNVYRWDGVTSSGVKAASGVYSPRLRPLGVQSKNNGQRVVLRAQGGNYRQVGRSRARRAGGGGEPPPPLSLFYPIGAGGRPAPRPPAFSLRSRPAPRT